MQHLITIRRTWLALLAAYVSLIFFVSSRPYLHAPGPEFDFKDKLAHAGEYFVLALLASRALRPARVTSRLVEILFVVAIGASIAAADELFQGTVPGRMTDIGDWAADVAGLALGAALAHRRRSGHKARTSVKP